VQHLLLFSCELAAFALVSVLKTVLYWGTAMVECNTLALNGKARAPAPTTKASSFEKYGARKNQILDALPDADFEQLSPWLEPIFLPVGMELRSEIGRATDAYFLISGVACRVCIGNNEETTELALIGREGMIGIESFLGGETSAIHSMMLFAGHAYRIKVSLLKEMFYRSDSMRRIFLLFVQSLLTQIAQTAVCNRHHSIEQQLSRFLLLCLDRLQSNELVVTQKMIGNLLGTRRESITDAAKKLQYCQAIDYRRGHISVFNRIALEVHACECYAVVKQEYNRLASKTIVPRAVKSEAIAFDGSSALHLATGMSREFQIGHGPP